MEQQANPNLGGPVPSSFSDAFAPSYLGNPDIVSGLVASYCAELEALLYQRSDNTIDAPEFLKRARSLILGQADIFTGRAPGFKTINGYHENTLQNKLVADLGEFWQKQRASWNDDAVAVLFEWLGVVMADKLRLANGDDMLFGIMLKPSVEYTVQVLLGIEKRHKPE